MGHRRLFGNETERIKLTLMGILNWAARRYIAASLKNSLAKKSRSEKLRRHSDLLTEMYLTLKDDGLSDLQLAKWLLRDKWFVPVRDLILASRPNYWMPLLIWWITSR